MQGPIADALDVGAQWQLTRHRRNFCRQQTDSDTSLSGHMLTACLTCEAAPDLQGIPIKAGTSRAPPPGTCLQNPGAPSPQHASRSRTTPFNDFEATGASSLMPAYNNSTGTAQFHTSIPAKHAATCFDLTSTHEETFNDPARLTCMRRL